MLGGTLGYYCRHAYAHTSLDYIGHLPYALKGLDLTVFAVFQRLGGAVRIRPVLDDPEFWGDQEDQYDDYGRSNANVRRDKDGNIIKRESKLIGTTMHRLKLDDIEADDDFEVTDTWPGKWRKNIEWLNEQGPMELAMVKLTVGDCTRDAVKLR